MALQAGTATTADFTNTSVVVTFDVVDSTKSVAVLIEDDLLVEETETFTASLTPVSGAVVPSEGRTATINILDTDGMYKNEIRFYAVENTM